MQWMPKPPCITQQKKTFSFPIDAEGLFVVVKWESSLYPAILLKWQFNTDDVSTIGFRCSVACLAWATPTNLFNFHIGIWNMKVSK